MPRFSFLSTAIPYHSAFSSGPAQQTTTLAVCNCFATAFPWTPHALTRGLGVTRVFVWLLWFPACHQRLTFVTDIFTLTHRALSSISSSLRHHRSVMSMLCCSRVSPLRFPEPPANPEQGVGRFDCMWVFWAILNQCRINAWLLMLTALFSFLWTPNKLGCLIKKLRLHFLLRVKNHHKTNQMF